MLIYGKILNFNKIQIVMIGQACWWNGKGRKNISKLNEY